MAKLAAAAIDSVRAEIFALGLNNHEARREVCRDCSKTNFKLDGLCWSTVFCTLYQRMGHPEINCFKACQLCTTPHHKADPCPTRQQAAELKEFLQGLDIPDMPSLDCLNFVKEAIKNEDRTKDRRDPDAANHIGFLKVPPVTKNTSNLAGKPFVFYSAVDCATLSGEYGLKEGEHFGHWQDTTFIENDMNRQAFLNAQIMDQAVVVLADTGANMSIIHPSIVKKLGMKVDTTKTTDISGLGGAAVVNTQGIVHIKLTIGRGLVYVFPIVVCDFGNTGFDAILGMDFLFRAGVMVDASRRELNLPEGEYVELHDQPVRYSRGYMNYVRLNRDVSILPGGSVVVPLPKLREGMPETLEYWVHRDVRWITTALNSENKPAAYKVTNVSERNVFLSAHTAVGAISAQGERPLDRPMVRTSSLKCQAWKAEAWEGSYPDDYRARLDEAAAELADDSSWKEPRPPSPRHLLTADGELRETCEVNDESSEGGRQPFADQAPGVPLSLTEAAKSKTPAVFCYHACHFRDTLPPPSILLMDTVPDNLDQRRMAKEVVLREGIVLSTEELEQQLAIIPEVPRKVEPFDPDQLDVGEDELSDDEKEKMRVVLRKYRKFFIKSGNGLPPPAKGAVCDIDVGEAKPLAERARRIRPELLKKLFDLLRGLLDFGLITFSNSPWASPIVLVLKKGGKDIRLCIDYRGINELQELMRSPMPTLDGMLANFHAMQWFLSLDNA
ncbi:hypothetical protein Ae201684P_004660 [Aphanomyces euteiches]|nr:hypothetical protein Ae201684P_004660 [Aphanomyces euteiches]